MQKELCIAGFCLALFAGNARAERYHFQGGGGPSFELFSPNLDFLDKQLQRFTPGFGKVDGPLILWGGFGFGEVDDNIRIGGYGFGGGFTESGTFAHSSDPKIRQDVTIEFGGGGFLAEYVVVHPARRFEVDLDLGLGFGGMEIAIAQFGPNATWEDMMGSLDPDSISTRHTFSINMAQGFFMAQPGIALKYYVNSFMAIEGRASYLWIAGLGEWKFRDTNILDMPDTDLSAPVFGLRLTFGG